MPVEPLRIAGKRVVPHKSVVDANFTERNVLTLTPWTFVDLWLKRNKHKSAVIYWEQARQFHEASKTLPLQSSPLLLYYAFMNAAKALLEVKGVPYTPLHGVKQTSPSQNARKLSLSGLEITIKQNGILPSLSRHFGEAEPDRVHSVEDILYNLPYVHRTFCLTYKSSGDMFFPLRECEYVIDTDAQQVYFRAKMGNDITPSAIAAAMPASIAADPDVDVGIRSTRSIRWNSNGGYADSELADLRDLHRSVRSQVYYINGVQTLWYLKTMGRKRLDRRSPTLTLAAMHRLSEICRYRPIELIAFMNGQRNWLLNEFVTMSPTQFFDEIASEITGYQFFVPNVRPAG